MRRMRTITHRTLVIASLLALPAAAPAQNALQFRNQAAIKTYRVQRQRVQETAQRLRQEFQGVADFRVVADPRSGKLIVHAPVARQSDVDRIVAGEANDRIAAARPTQPGQGNAAARPTNRRAAAAPTATPPRQASRLLQLKNLDWRNFLGSVQTLVGRKLDVQSSANGQQLAVQLPVKNAPSIGATVDRTRKTITLRGAEPSVRQWEDAVRELDREPWREADQARLVPIARSTPDSIARLIAILRVAMSGGRPWAGDMVGMIFQQQPQGNQPAGGPAGDEIESQPVGPNPAAMQLVQQMAGEGGVLGNVRLEFIEGLDIIVIRGNKRDVDRVVALINQIEILSQRTEPKIELVHLKNTESVSLAETVNEVSTAILQARLGNVSITPLVKPNALLVIGRPESVDSTKDLIELLDQPVNPDTQIRVFKLRHMPSADAARAILQFYPNPQQAGAATQEPGRERLAPKVRVVSEFRTNAVIVWGSPGDMKEITHMLAELDVPEAETVSEVMVFKLKNALAEEMAELLQLTLRAGEEDRRQQAGGGGAGAATGQQPTYVSPRSSSVSITIDAETKQVLSSGILTDVRVAADVRANSLVITAPPEARELLTELVRQLDQLPTAEATVKVFEIVNGDATSLRDMLEALFAEQEGQDGQPALQTAGSDEDSSLVPLRFTVDTRSNSIIATGSEADLQVVFAILTRLDEADVRDRVNKVYKLSNAPAEEVALAINQYLDEIRAVQDVAPDALSQFEQVEREVVVVSEPVSNSLIINATEEYVDKIEQIVEDLDSQPPMVMIQVLIAEVELDDAEELGVELGIQDSLLFDRSLLGDLLTTTNSTSASTADGVITTTNEIIQSATNVPGFNFNNQPLGNSGSNAALATASKVAGQALSSFALGRSSSQLGYGGLVLSASSESVSVLLRALQQTRRLEVLTRPMVVTMHNQEASVLVGQQVPRITTSQITDTGTINTTVYEPVGIQLLVTPRISPDGQIVMEIAAVKSQLDESEGVPISTNSFGDVIRQPIIDTTEATTTVSALSGQTVILGGLIQKDRFTIERGVPMLMDIPVLGNLFRYDSFADSRKELLIILTPRVIENREELDRLQMLETERMSWCLADVVDIHGSVPGDSMNNLVDTQVIYPDLDPTAPESLPAEEQRVNPVAPLGAARSLRRPQQASVPKATPVEGHEFAPLSPLSDGGTGSVIFDGGQPMPGRPPEPRDDLVAPAGHWDRQRPGDPRTANGRTAPRQGERAASAQGPARLPQVLPQR